MVPHHVEAYARCGTTSLSETVWLCEQSHRDVHVGKKVIRSKDGRWPAEDGWRDGPDRP